MSGGRKDAGCEDFFVARGTHDEPTDQPVMKTTVYMGVETFG